MAESIPRVDPHSLKVVELREELSKRGLETKGLKKDLVDRLEKAQDLALGGGTELAAPTEEAKAQAVPPKQITEEANAAKDDVANEEAALAVDKKEEETAKIGDVDGVGHSMVEGALEVTEEMEKKVDEEVKIAEDEIPQPAVFDNETAEVIRREEVKEQLLIEPSPPRAISPAPPTASASPRIPEEGTRADTQMDVDDVRPNVLTPPLPTVNLPTEDNFDGLTSTKRSSEEETVPPPKRHRPISSYITPLPSSLSHLKHPPTATIYITNLRRPLLHSSLHSYLSPSLHPATLLPPPRNPFGSEEYPGLWLSGIKDHAYATYPSEEDALEVAERIEGVKWPEDTGDTLHVEFIPDDRVLELVEREEKAWSNGRQKLTLNIQKKDDGEVDFELLGSGSIGPKRPGASGAAPAQGRPVLIGQGTAGLGGVRPGDRGPGYGPGARGPVLSGSNAIGTNGRVPPGAPGAPSGPSGMGIRGRGGIHAVPPHLARSNGDDRGRGGRYGSRPEPGYPGRWPLGPSGGGWGEGRLAAPIKSTRYRPSLTWREGPGAFKR